MYSVLYASSLENVKFKRYNSTSQVEEEFLWKKGGALFSFKNPLLVLFSEKLFNCAPEKLLGRMKRKIKRVGLLTPL